MDQLFETTSFYFFLVNSHQFEIYYYKKLTFNVKGFLPYRFSCYPYYGSDYAPILLYPWYTFLPGIRRPCAICSTSYASVYPPFPRQEIGISGRSRLDPLKQGYKSSIGNYFSYRLFQLIIEFSSLFEKCLFLFLQIIFSSRN